MNVKQQKQIRKSKSLFTVIIEVNWHRLRWVSSKFLDISTESEVTNSHQQTSLEKIEINGVPPFIMEWSNITFSLLFYIIHFYEITLICDGSTF